MTATSDINPSETEDDEMPPKNYPKARQNQDEPYFQISANPLTQASDLDIYYSVSRRLFPEYLEAFERHWKSKYNCPHWDWTDNAKKSFVWKLKDIYQAYFKKYLKN